MRQLQVVSETPQGKDALFLDHSEHLKVFSRPLYLKKSQPIKYANNQILDCTEFYQYASKPSSAKLFVRSNEPTSSWRRLGLHGINDSLTLEYLTVKEYCMSKNLYDASENSERSRIVALASVSSIW